MTESLPASANRPEAPQGPPPNTVLVCDHCRRHLLRRLGTQGWWCYQCGDRPIAPALVYDRRR